MTGTTVTPAVSASNFVKINPSVLEAEGAGLDLLAVILTDNKRVPIGTIVEIPNDGVSLEEYLGSTSHTTALGTVYFNGVNTLPQKPAFLYLWQYVWQEPVAAYLRGGSVSALTLAQLQALSGNINVNIDGVPEAATVNLSGATSFSNAASIIGNAMSIKGVPQGSYTGSIAGNVLTVATVVEGPQTAVYTGSISGNTLTVTSVLNGYINVGDLVMGSGVTPGTTITALGTGEGNIGTYTLNNTLTLVSGTLTNFAASGVLAVGDVLGAVGIVAGTYIAQFLNGQGGVGTYQVSASQTYAGGTFTAYLPGVAFDSISGAYVINSGTTGVGSSIGFAAGTLATSLNLTQATGATTSQGAAQSTPAAAMNSIIAITKNFASYFTSFEPSDADKEGFALWNNGQNKEYVYVEWETNILDTEAGGPSPAWAAITKAAYDGVSLNYSNPAVDPLGGQVAAFVAGYIASVDYDAVNGRATAAYKAQDGLAPQVFSDTVYDNIIAYGGNCYQNATTANNAFTFYSDGSVTGTFDWLDSYIDQIWLNNNFQLSLLTFLTTINSLSYNQAGYNMIESVLVGDPQEPGPITQGVTNGVIAPNVPLSSSQADAVNAAAGVAIDGVLSTRGWYLQILPGTAQVRKARTSPPINFWYNDGGAIQKIVVNSVTVQ
jgi:hypothetical protein